MTDTSPATVSQKNPSSVKVKFCGIREHSDLIQVIKLGADFAGFIFHPPSPRFISPVQAKTLIDSTDFNHTQKVGVVVNLPIEEAKKIVGTLDLEVIQLHGEEDTNYINQLQNAFPALTIWKAIQVGGEGYSSAKTVTLPSLPVEYFLLDKFVSGQQGGTGKSIPLDLVEKYCILQSNWIKIIIAGGIKPDNVLNLINLSVNPWAIDINSGVEDAPGKKNHKLMNQMIELIRKNY